jgi:hypothetical protein
MGNVADQLFKIMIVADQASVPANQEMARCSTYDVGPRRNIIKKDLTLPLLPFTIYWRPL